MLQCRAVFYGRHSRFFLKILGKVAEVFITATLGNFFLWA